MFFKLSKDFEYNPIMLFLIIGFGEDEQVIDVDHNDVFHVGKDLVHHCLEGGG